ncbi:MAG: MMPL family transporter [Oligoflexia bacterium]|nr:MMPL family transporter [Oligoflexia bacterium]
MHQRFVVGRFIQWVLRYRYGVVGLALLLSLLAGAYAVRLYGTLKTDLEELLPTDSRSVQDLQEVRQRLRGIDSLNVLIFAENGDAGKRFVDELVARLRQGVERGEDQGLVARIEYRIDRELRFFQRRRALYLEVEDLQRVRDYLEQRIFYERELRNPLNIFNDEEIAEPRMDFNALERRYSGRVEAYTRFPEGYYATPDGKRRVVLIFMEDRPDKSRALKAFKSFVERALSDLNPARYDSGLEIRYTGNVQNLIEEQDAILADLVLSFVVVALLVTAALVAYFRSTRGTLATLTGLTMGTLWTMGLSYFFVGDLNANSAFLGSIIFGNGINFGIIFTARYLEERRKGGLRDPTLILAARATYSATWTAALAAGLSYGSLALTGFRGFRQFGVIGLVGMVLCWIASFTVLPALLGVMERERPGKPPAAAVPVPPIIRFGWVSGFIARRARTILAATLVATAIATLLLFRLSPEVLEADLTRIRSRKSLESGSAYYSRHVDEIFQRYLSPVIILADGRVSASLIAERLKRRSEAEGAASLLASVQTIRDFLPRDQARKRVLLREIRQLLPRRIVRQLAPAERKRVEDFLTPESLRPVLVRDLPPVILERFTERDGSVGRMVLVEPPLGPRIKERENLFRFVRELREEADSVRRGFPVAGTMPVTADMLRSIAEDGPRATLFAFLAVVTLVTALFRKLKVVGSVLASLFLGVSWLMGLILALGIKINFLNFIALPITFGIGVDYGVNILQRYRQEGRGSILRVVRETGGAVALCSVTTIIGYGSLLFASNLAFFSFGLIAVFGEFTCIGAALLSIPAAIYLRDRGLLRKSGGDERSHGDAKVAQLPSTTTAASQPDRYLARCEGVLR